MNHKPAAAAVHEVHGCTTERSDRLLLSLPYTLNSEFNTCCNSCHCGCPTYSHRYAPSPLRRSF